MPFESWQGRRYWTLGLGCLLFWCAAGHPAPSRRPFCPSAAHAFSFDSDAAVDRVEWSTAKLRLVNAARYSKASNALRVDSGGYAEIDWVEAGGTSLTFTTWFAADAAVDNAGLFSFGVADSFFSQSYIFAQLHTSSNVLSVGHGGYADLQDLRLEDVVNAPAFVAPDQWSHLAAVFDRNGTTAVYLNASLVAVHHSFEPVPYAVRLSSYIGRSHVATDAHFRGWFADFAIYYETLSDAVIAGLLNGETHLCPAFQPASNFTFASVGGGLQGAGLQGDVSDFVVYNYDILKPLFGTTATPSTQNTALLFGSVAASTFVIASAGVLLLVLMGPSGNRKHLTALPTRNIFKPGQQEVARVGAADPLRLQQQKGARLSRPLSNRRNDGFSHRPYSTIHV